MLLHFYVLGLVLLAALPVLMMTKNIALFRRLPANSADSTSVSVLIPARNEEKSIAACVEHVLASSDHSSLALQVVVMDDASTDRTREICEMIAQQDTRLNVMIAPPLPQGWNGKQHACWQLAQHAESEWLLFIDADVRLAAGGISRMLGVATAERLDLLSGFPRQITGTFFERLLIPLMHFILLGYLPIARMRSSTAPEYAAGCGQLFLARRQTYDSCDGHRAIAGSRHDGIKLPRVFRRHGLKTDIFDASDIASCRMYRSGGQVFRGLMKNATEGIGNPRTIVPFTILLAGGGVLPLASLIVALANGWPAVLIVGLIIATCLSYYARWLPAKHFQQSLVGTVLHPLSVAVFLFIQWLALFAHVFGVKVRWRGRV